MRSDDEARADSGGGDGAAPGAGGRAAAARAGPDPAASVAAGTGAGTARSDRGTPAPGCRMETDSPLEGPAPEPTPPGGSVDATEVGLALLLATAAAVANFTVSAPPLERALFFLPVLLPVFYQRSRTGTLIVAAGAVAAAAASELAAARWGARPFDLSLLSAVALILATCALGALLLRRRLEVQPSCPFIDEATGLPGRQMVGLILRKNIEAARRGQSLTVAMVRMDGTEEHDRRCGCGRGPLTHRARVAEVLQASIRDMDFLGRLDEESFLAVVLHESSNGVSVLADRLRSRVEELGSGEEPACTVSVGIVTFEQGMEGPRELVRRARDTVERAQELGGNRVLVARRQGFREGPRRPTFPAHLRVM